MPDPVRGVTCPDMRRVVREALANGWEFAGWTGTTHAQIRWPKTGDILRFGSTPSVASWKSLANDIRRVSGVEVWRRGNRRRSRKAPDLSGFTLEKAARETARWHEAYDVDVDRLRQERDTLIDRARSAAASGRRHDLVGLADVLRRITVIETELADVWHQPVEPFDPYSLQTT